MKKPSIAETMIAHIKAHGPSTREELLAACGIKPTSCGSYFRTVEARTSPYYNEAAYQKQVKGSLIATGRLAHVGMRGKLKVYGLGPNA